MTLQISDGKNEVIEVGNKVLKAINRPMTKDDVNERLNKLGNTIYKFENLNIEMDDNVFIPIKELNDIKNNAISKLNEKRLYKYEYIKQEYSIDLKNYKKEKNYNIYLSTLKQYEKIKNELKEKYSIEIDNIEDVSIVPYIYNMEEIMNIVDLVVSRSGAMTITEIANVGVPAIFIPFPFATENHQEYNAKVLENIGAAKIILDKNLTSNELNSTITNLVENKNALKDMGKKANQVAIQNVEEKIYKEIKEL